MSKSFPITNPLAIAAERSNNAKIGAMSATYATQRTCPATCPLRDNGCYAESGFVGITTRRLNRAAKRLRKAVAFNAAKQEAQAIDALSGAYPLRLHIVGDCTTNRDAQLLSKAATRYTKRGGCRVYTYTHSWRTIRRKSWGVINVLASCETLAQVKEAHKLGYAASLVVAEHRQEKLYKLGGVRLLPCPAQTKHITCSECRLCMNDEYLHKSKTVIAFAAHGANANKAKQLIQIGVI
jgi:hypothetical protein